jgi:nicotinamide mononucleotide transporter
MLVNSLFNKDKLEEFMQSMGLGIFLTLLCILITQYGIDSNYSITPLELVGVIFNFVCVYLTIKENNWAWITGMIATIALGILFFNLGLYSSMILSIGFFLPMQFYGLWNWLYGNNGGEYMIEKEINLKENRIKRLMLILMGSVLLFVPFYIYFMMNAGATYPILDAGILFLSMIAQVLLAHKLPISWLVWILVNTLSVYVYFQTGALALALQYVVFWCHALYGYYTWNKKVKSFG